MYSRPCLPFVPSGDFAQSAGSIGPPKVGALKRHFLGKSPDIATDGVYAEIAGANSCENKVLRSHRGNS